jgi:hypothetical protein
VTLTNGLTLSVVGVGAIRFWMWDGMINMVTDVWYVPNVQMSLVSLSKLDSRGGSMKVLRGDMIIIREIRHDSFYEMVGTMEFTSTIVSVSTPT